jgi:antirestriction protein ArdC
MKRDLYATASARIVAELERGAKPWLATPGANTPSNAVSNRPYSGRNVVLLWMAQAAGYHTPRFSNIQAGFGVGRQRPQGRARHKVYFVKQCRSATKAWTIARQPA